MATDYTELITSQYREQPVFVAAVALMTQHSNDNQTLLATFAGLFDLDTAMGVQLDELGVWAGLGRYIFVPTLGTVTLNDTDYRILLRAKILKNHWDGTNAMLQVILSQLFPGTGITLVAVDNQDMSMDIYIFGGTPTPTQLALLKGGLIVPKPEGVRINGFILVTGPLFGLDQEDTAVAGLDVGQFASYL